MQAHRPGRPDLFEDVEGLWSQDKEVFGSRGRIDTTLGVGMAAAAWAPLRRLLDADVPDRLRLTDTEVEDLLDGAAERLEGSGVAVSWDPALNNTLQARVVVGTTGSLAQSVPEVFDESAVQGFSWRIYLDGEPLSDDEIESLARNNRPVTRLRDQWVLVPPVQAERARKPDLRPLTAIDALSVALTGSTTIDGRTVEVLSLIHISEPTRHTSQSRFPSYA
mgnify:FL=1